MRCVFLAFALALCNCSNIIKDAAAGISDPTERGLMYVATAIVLAAVIKALFNK
jgi:hypothetical protein